MLSFLLHILSDYRIQMLQSSQHKSTNRSDILIVKVIIHVGPPKTGSSAIQKWCLENTNLLLEQKIYYPEHNLDVNGVSSGNVLALFDRDEVGNLWFSSKKLNAIKRLAEDKGADTVLFSSEFFFKQIPTLASNIRNCLFVSYIRFELETIESNYKQSVKRHGQTNKFNIPKYIKSNTLKLFTEFAQQYGKEKFVFRAYGNNVFFCRDLIADFLDAINLKILIQEGGFKSPRVNSGYSPEGLEYKRWFNKFQKSELQAPLDHFLQKQATKSNKKYSLISPDEFLKLKTQCLKDLEEFCKQFKVGNGLKLLEEIAEQRPPTYQHQELSIKQFEMITQQFVEDRRINHQLMDAFIQDLSISPSSVSDRVRLQTVLRVCEATANQKASIENVFNYLYSTSYLAAESAYRHFKRWDESRNKLASVNNLEKSNIVTPHIGVELVSHNIPFVLGNIFVSSISAFYGNQRTYIIDKSRGIAELNKGEEISIPDKVKAVQGNIVIHPNHEKLFPRAIRVCWVRDPLERLWLHFESILNTHRPQKHYELIKDFAASKNISCRVELFKSIIESDEFLYLTNFYQRYLGSSKSEKFDFIGSVNNYTNDIVKLGNITNTQLTVDEGLLSLEIANVPKEVLSMKDKLKNEYELVSQFLHTS